MGNVTHKPNGTVSVETSEDATQAAANLGVEIYPGATAVKGSSVSGSFGGMNIGAATLETDDSVATVGEFYSNKYPNSLVGDAKEDKQEFIVNTDKATVVIAVQSQSSGKTKIVISRMAGAKKSE